jgi:SAM-dependent MidA family methyltransferase
LIRGLIRGLIRCLIHRTVLPDLIYLFNPFNLQYAMTHRGLNLPAPDAVALQTSNALLALICAEIGQQSTHTISFARYMELALYQPGLGYYSGGATKLGKDGDFTTAPEMCPLFGQALARSASTLLPERPMRILELGAGSGQLAHDFLKQCQSLGLEIQQYAILELSGSLRARQQAILHQFPQVCWLDAWPMDWHDGPDEGPATLVLANEVLDAMPVHLVQKQNAGWHEMQVGQQDGKLCWRSQPCTPALLACIERQIPDAASLPAGYTTEIHPLAAAFIQSLGQLLSGLKGPGAAVLIDYGFPAHEYYLPQRHQGTLYCHYRHHAHDDPFYLPGLQDLTAHVDFTDIARQAQLAGMEVLSYTSQAAFLLDSGITDCLMHLDPADASVWLPQSSALQRLISPAEMGELFKVILLGHQCTLPPQYARNNRSHRL